jgi:hypothetical protein
LSETGINIFLPRELRGFSGVFLEISTVKRYLIVALFLLAAGAVLAAADSDQALRPEPGQALPLEPDQSLRLEPGMDQRYASNIATRFHNYTISAPG